MKLIIDISKCEYSGRLAVGTYIKMPAMPTFSKDGYADTKGMSVSFYNSNKQLMEEFATLAEHIEQEVEKFHQAYGDSLPSNDSTTGQSESKLSNFSLNSSSDTEEPSDKRITTE